MSLLTLKRNLKSVGGSQKRFDAARRQVSGQFVSNNKKTKKASKKVNSEVQHYGLYANMR